MIYEEASDMRNLIILLIIWLCPLGCSHSMTSPETPDGRQCSPHVIASANQWEWGSYTIAISADRSKAEVIPTRTSSWHLNVTPFVEGPPCPTCLAIGKPQLQGDGTIKLKVWLRHPFPGHLEYTGFDVRGIVVFIATDYMKAGDYTIHSGHGAFVQLMYPVKLNYSDPSKGGAALLNLDGYTFYLNPLLEYKDGWNGYLPILNYSKGKYAYGDSPDCTVNPYILFSDGSPRHMFKTTDFMTRTFHIKPPAGGGAFEFGYVVSACWFQPTITPVTNPETDFPIEANCEDPWQITIEQLEPINYDVTGQPLFKARIKHRPCENVTWGAILVPDLSTSPTYSPGYGHIRYVYTETEYTNIIDDETTEIILRIKKIEMNLIGDGLVPGHHLGILSVKTQGEAYGNPGPYETQFYQPLGVMPVDVYVEL